MKAKIVISHFGPLKQTSEFRLNEEGGTTERFKKDALALRQF